jgi:UDP-glucose 4-epimerase
VGIKYFVTGAAGFIGSHLVDSLLSEGREVVGFDNFSTGYEAFLESARQQPTFRLVRGDVSDPGALTQAMKGCQVVFHLAGNDNMRLGLSQPRFDLEQNTLGTFNVLEAMRATGAKTILFTSTGNVYGETPMTPTPEDCPLSPQTSLYAASKLASEALIEAYCAGFGIEGYIFRLVSVLGERYTHGHVMEFYRGLLQDDSKLKVLGDGHQRKSYLNVHDCVAAMHYILELETARQARNRVEIYNLGTTEYCEINDSIRWISGFLGLTPQLEYVGGPHGWIGDNPFLYLDVSKALKTGWKPDRNIQESIRQTVTWICDNEWVAEKNKC